MKISIAFIVLLMIGQAVFSQLSITYTTPQDAANYITGTGVQISNVSFIGNSMQLAKFSNGNSYFGFNDGVILTTGNASFAATTNTSNWGIESVLVPTPTAGTEIDLSLLLPPYLGQLLFSPAVLEFDFVSNGTNVEFYFVFASEEYPKFELSEYEDVFGLFLSGPGINGPFSNNGVNIALIPGTSTYISVNNVNSTTNSNYFIANHDNYGAGTLTYGGYTTTIKAEHDVECGQTYHLRIGITNVADYLRDAAVMIQKGSLTSDFAPGQLTASPMTVCEGEPLLLTIQNPDPSWHYQWSTGNTGIGLSQITTNADYNSSMYSVTVTNIDGCSITRNVDVVVHPINNIAPYVNGINNSGEYTAYVQAGQNLQFPIPSFDNPEENVTISWNNGIYGASFYSVSGDQFTNHEKGIFSWTPTNSDIGVHEFTVTVTDNNYCSPLSQTFTFKVKVVCSFCPLVVYYENRTPQNNPLPNETVAGHAIVAGENVDPAHTNGPVNTGDDEVIFRAPEIYLEPGFTAGPGFWAIADDNACIDECNDCCDNWNGFTFDFIPNIMTPNNDGYNDIWYLPDVNHPYCAFNAQGFDLIIYSSWGNIVYTQSYFGTECCPFEAPSPPSYNILHSSIYWDGINTIGEMVSDGVYYYVLTLYGCSNEESYHGSITVYGSPKSPVTNTELQKNNDVEDIALDLSEPDTYEINIFPNPASDEVFVTHSFSSVRVELFSELGQLLSEVGSCDSKVSIDLSSFEPGVYYLRVVHNNGVIKKKIVKL